MLHSRKENFGYALHKPHEQEELQGITHHYILYSNHSFVYFIYQKIIDVTMTQSQTFTVTCEKWCSCVQNYTEHLSHNYTTMTVTKTNATISLTQPNDVSLDCQVFRLPF